jgi:hypothetical protein
MSKPTETEKVRQVKSKGKSMLIIFSHIKGIVLASQTVSSTYYYDVLQRLCENLQRLCPEL